MVMGGVESKISVQLRLKINNNKMSPHQNMPVLVIFVPATYAIIDLILTKFPKQFYRTNLFGDKKL